ncbi:Fc.00g021580.m01.CDS01 [Cosmosporella sp. VM-42]
MNDTMDKEWARKYILDPLTAPEPSQETGIGSSHVNRTLSLSTIAAGKQPAEKHSPKSHHHHRKTNSYPTPPTSASPTNSSFHPSNPFSNANRLDTHSEEASISPPGSPLPRPTSGARRYPPSTFVTRSSSARIPDPVRHRPQPVHHRSFSDGNFGLERNPSLNQRYPGDMSHRPLEMLKKEARAAERAPHLRRKNIPITDTIDALDTIGGTYHHGGPYDATLASRNRNKMYSPVAAVHETNMEAIRATPREYLQDSLRRHMPLQGTATIPSGDPDMSGNAIHYEEGADLMREPDATGGPYKRYEHIPYHPDDLKGKGEPSYTYERDLKERKKHRHTQSNEYELQSRPPHTRSYSNHGEESHAAYSNSADIRRSNTTGKRLSDGIKRRFGSIRRKKVTEVQ